MLCMRCCSRRRQRTNNTLRTEGQRSLEERRIRDQNDIGTDNSVESHIFTTNNASRLNNNMSENGGTISDDFASEAQINDDGTKLTWQDVATTLDWACFVLLSLITLTASVGSLMMCTVFNDFEMPTPTWVHAARARGQNQTEISRLISLSNKQNTYIFD